jgi:DNA polymerase-3 subunit alpha
MFGMFDSSAPQGAAPSAGDYTTCEPWDQKELLARERASLGFYVSGHPLDRYLRGGGALARLEAVPVASISEDDAWAVVKLVGMVEGYRERVFKDGGGKMAFFELEDLTGRVNVKVRGNSIDTYAPVLSSGEPVLLTGKVSFPRRDDDAPEEGADVAPEPTILLNDAVLLRDAVARDARQLVIKLHAKGVKKEQLSKLRDVVSASRGACQVVVHLSLESGAEALLSLGKDHRVEVTDALLSGLERVFGAQVAELR